VVKEKENQKELEEKIRGPHGGSNPLLRPSDAGNNRYNRSYLFLTRFNTRIICRNCNSFRSICYVSISVYLIGSSPRCHTHHIFRFWYSDDKTYCSEIYARVR
jgi:hypothetical protein